MRSRRPSGGGGAGKEEGGARPQVELNHYISLFTFIRISDGLKYGGSQADAVAGARRVDREAADRARLLVGGGNGVE